MKKFLFIIAVVSMLFACKNETPEASLADLDRLATLENQVNQLQMDNQLKDSMLNEAIGFFNEIQRNLASIGLKESELKSKNSNPEIAGNEKEQILEQINYINFLRTENGKKIQLLQNQLKESKLKSNQLQEMLSQLTEQIRQKDEQIESLQQELALRDQEYSKLFDQYQAKSYQNEELITQLNTVYYVYGSSKELKENQVISESKGFIGMGKKAILKTGFNESYFTETSIDKSKSISISGKSIKLITDHPADAFQIVSENGREKLKITNPKLFWKVSKYLVVIID
jgi:DNA repair exonuclease SbcCD ATPase subunit